ncbi:MAG TPA: penicillin acylase family protein, partial [Myxococcota bacterium]|nr:penicillin acylase family protein [Myxococcota bacterium]
ASGSLSEPFGSIAEPVDERARELQLRETAERLVAAAGDESRALLEAYARGVNAWLAERGGDLPPELRLVGLRPEPWTPADSLCFHVLMARDLALYRDEERRRFAWLAGLGLERTRELTGLADLDPQPEVALAARRLGDAWARAAAAPHVERDDGREPGPDAEPTGRGSNDWALGDSWTATGRPIVANDPHLGLGLPGTWYQATLRAPDYEAAGMTLPGLPVVVIGQTQELAWAFTNTELDVSDVYLEETNEDGTAVRRGGDWLPIEVRRETLHSKDGDRELVLRSTDLGPFSPADDVLPAHSLAWTGFEPFDPLATFTALARARNLDEAEAALDPFVCPVQNVLLADAAGELRLAILGCGPQRGRGAGRLPLPGWDPAYRWRGLADASSKPRVVDPPADFLCTANNDVRPPGFTGAFSMDPDTPYRNDRIARTLAERRSALGALSVRDCLDAQRDHVSLYALAVLRASVVEPLGESSPRAERARDLLLAWGGAMDAEPGAALFAAFEDLLGAAILDDELAGLPRPSSSDRRRILVAALDGTLGGWIDDVGTPETETRGRLVAAALELAWDACSERFGPDPANWDYTAAHTLELHHPLGSLPLVGRLLDRGPFPVAGSSSSILAFGGPETAPGAERVTHGPSMRFVADVGDPDGSLAVLPGGQSGHPFDGHYADQLDDFLEGRAFPVLWSEAAVAEHAVSSLRLEP